MCNSVIENYGLFQRVYTFGTLANSTDICIEKVVLTLWGFITLFAAIVGILFIVVSVTCYCSRYTHLTYLPVLGGGNDRRGTVNVMVEE